jgi:hypothetical protein
MADDLWIEPVVSSSTGVFCFARLLIFRTVNALNTRTSAITKVSRVRQGALSQGTANSFFICRAPTPEKRAGIGFYVFPLNGLLERDWGTSGGRAKNGVGRHSSSGSEPRNRGKVKRYIPSLGENSKTLAEYRVI